MGGKKKGGSAHTPYEAPNTLYSKQIVKVLDVLSEGPVEGLANGDTHPFKSTFFNDTPVQSENGDFNFKGFELAINDGDQDQVYFPEFDVVEKTNQVNADVKQDTPITRTVTDPYVSSVRVTVGVKGLVEMKDNGDRLPTSVTMTVSILKAGNYYASKVVTIREKGTETYYQDVTFNDLPEAPFDIRVARNTPDSKTDKIQNATIFPSFVETIDAKLSYPFLAMAGYKFDAMQFGSSLPRINTLLKGRIVQIPTNYDPINRTYTGMWDGSFKLGWTDNPAWIIYDFITNERYGGKIDPRYVDRAALYRVSQFCDELVDDGYGGKEPRVTFNAYYTDDKKFRDRLQDMCSSFFGHAIWNGKYLSFTLDNDEDPVALYTNANVVDGNFSYEGISNSAVITTVHVQYIDKNDAYRQKTEVVEDRNLLRRYRTNVQKVVAEGCTSRSQAHRLGRYILEKSRLRQTISFRIGAEGLKHRPFDVIQIADNHLAGTNIGGRVMAIDGKTVTLDREVENATKGTFSYLGVEEGKLKKIDLEITEQIDSKKLRLKEIPEDLRKFSAWSLSRSDVKPKYYRALGISQGNDGTFSIKAIEHEVGLQDRLASGLKFEEDPDSIWSSFPEITNNTIGNDGDTVVISWENINSDTTALTYIVKLYKDGKIYRKYEDLAEPNLRFEGLPDGEYVVEIQARNARGQLSNTLKEYFSLNYTVTALTAEPLLFAVQLKWQLPTIVNTAISIEVWRAEKDDINKARLLVTLPHPQSEYQDSGMSATDSYYYWVRIIDKNGRTGEFTRSMLGEPKTDPSDITDILDGVIGEKQISKDLQDQFDRNIEDAIKESEIAINNSINKLEHDNEKLNISVDKLNVDDILKDITLSNEGSTRHSQDNKLEANVADAHAQIEETKGVIAEEKKAQAEINTSLTSRIDSNVAEINQIKVTQVDDQKVVAILKEDIKAQFDKNEADATLSMISLATESETRSQQDLMLSANVADAHAEIEETKNVIAEEKKAQAEINTSLTSKIDSNVAEINQIKATQVDDQKAVSALKSETSARFDKNEADQVLENISLATEGYSRASQYSVISVTVAGNSSSIEELSNTFSNFDGTMSEKITQLQSKTDSHQSQITQISSTQAKTDGKVDALWTLKVDANGAVGGIMLGSDGRESQFKVSADTFVVSTPDQSVNMFSLQQISGKTVAALNGDLIAKGSISGDKITANTSIQAPVIKGGRVESGHFAGGSINIGNGNFNVDSNGNLYAKSGRFEGTVYADKIEGDVVKVVFGSRNKDVTIPPVNFRRRLILSEGFVGGYHILNNQPIMSRAYIYINNSLAKTIEVKRAGSSWTYTPISYTRVVSPGETIIIRVDASNQHPNALDSAVVFEMPHFLLFKY